MRPHPRAMSRLGLWGLLGLLAAGCAPAGRRGAPAGVAAAAPVVLFTAAPEASVRSSSSKSVADSESPTASNTVANSAGDSDDDDARGNRDYDDECYDD